MSQKIEFSHVFGATTVNPGSTNGLSTHLLSDISGIQIQSRAPMYLLNYYGVSVMARSGTWGVRIMARSPAGQLYPIAGMTGITQVQAVLGFPAPISAGNSAFQGLPAPVAIEYATTGGVSSSFSANVFGLCMNP